MKSTNPSVSDVVERAGNAGAEAGAGTAGEGPVPPREFGMWFTPTPRGARLARRLVSHRLDEWGHPYASTANETITSITSELTANAVHHGLAGRDFHVRLTESARCLRVEVTDARPGRVPPSSVQEPSGDAECGRGLLLVSHLSTRWGVLSRAGTRSKTVWAELCLC